MGRHQAYNLIQGTTNLLTAVNILHHCEIQLIHEKQVRPLSPLEPEQQCEVWEEAGFRVQVRRVIGVYDANRSGPLEFFHAFKLIFLCDLIDGSPTPSDETSEVAFFGRDELPAVLSGERTRPRHLLHAFAMADNPDLPTFFD
mgnify:CR=1 FL=1